MENETWPCGHPRTELNTQTIGKAGKRCRQCRQLITREHNRRKQGFYTRNPDISPRGPALTQHRTETQP